MVDRNAGDAYGDDLFTMPQLPFISHRLAAMAWPSSSLFPTNHAQSRVADHVWPDLATSKRPLAVAGFASLAQIVELAAARTDTPGQLRVLLGSEPFTTTRVSFGSPSAAFTEQVREYWTQQRGVSLRLSAKIVQAIHACETRALDVRFVPGDTKLHAKIYVGDNAATLGSSNFTDNGLRAQFEANARFDRKGEPTRYQQAQTVAENYWTIGEDWNLEFVELLNTLLQFVSWQEALARACADLLEGSWAARYLPESPQPTALWPSQVLGIAEALWVVENLGSVLVADATGSGKTRMGAHLTRAVRDRLWSTGRVHSDLCVLVSPPAVQEQWRREALECALPLITVSHGRLSRAAKGGEDLEGSQVAQSQVLVIDEAHNFLSSTSNRTQRVRDHSGDHVLLFTATPINKGPEDLLSLVDLLGADNFHDETLQILDDLTRTGQHDALSGEQRELIREEIQRFTVRRTKSALNALVEREPDAYRSPATGRVSRYPRQVAATYATGETKSDEAAAEEIRARATQLRGIIHLGRLLTLPATLRRKYNDEQWLRSRLAASAGLSRYHVLSAMRSSKAALMEHLVGTQRASNDLGLDPRKMSATGDVISRLADFAEGTPPNSTLKCELPSWLHDPQEWATACLQEQRLYEEILTLTKELSQARELAKADLIACLARRHPRLLAFDHHPITLAAIASHLSDAPAPVMIASGSHVVGKKSVKRAMAAGSQEHGIALCSDALNEGLNLQGADVVVHLDLPTTLRVAEQRVGRVDRMDSPYDEIHSWWPDDGPAFATRANELLARRNAESASLLGSNLLIPDDIQPREETIDLASFVARASTKENEDWDGLRDALDPVRRLVHGPERLVPPAVYRDAVGRQERVVARVSPVTSEQPWAFFTVRGHTHGAPRWLLLEQAGTDRVSELGAVASALRRHLSANPPSRQFDSECETWLATFLNAASLAEAELLPRRLQRALEQLRRFTALWADEAVRSHDLDTSTRWRHIHSLTDPRHAEQQVAMHQLAESWLSLTRTHRATARANQRPTRRYSLIKDSDPYIRQAPLSVEEVERELMHLAVVEPFESRVNACILGVPASEGLS